MIWIGLTGGIASGKSTAAKMISEMGIPVLDADQISKKLTMPTGLAFGPIVTAFGADILDEKGVLDRRKLGQIVFGRPEMLSRLESILHPLIRSEIEKQKKELESQGHFIAVYDVPLLFEKNMQDQFDEIIVVCVDQEMQIQRMKMRDQLTEQQARQRLSHQIPINDKIKLANFVVYNDSSVENLKDQLQDVFLKIKSKNKLA